MADISVPGLATQTPVLADTIPAVRASTGLLDCRFTLTALRTLMQSGLATVATTGAYSSLSGIPTLGTVAPLNLNASTTQFLRGDGTFAVPPGLAVNWGSIGGTLSSQTDLQTALNLKANSSSLATVATTGVYNDLTGKPTLGTVAALSYPGGTTTFLRADGNFAAPPGGGGAAWGSITGTLSAQTDLDTALGLKAPLASPTFTGTVSGVTKAMVSLGNVDNTSDANKPVSTATQTALNLKADLASPTFTGTVSGITKAMVSLGNVDNTTDANKPVSTATQTALNLKADLASPALTGNPTAPTAAVGDNDTSIATTGFVIANKLIEQNSQSTAYTAVLADANKHLLHPSADTTARVFTIPANSSVAYPIGTALTFVNQNAAGVMTIAITSDTMRLAGAGTTGSRTLAANGIATALKLTSTEWIINGTGLT